MEQKKLIIKIAKDIDISDAVSKALYSDKQNYKTVRASKKQENSIQEGKLSSSIGEFRGVAG